MCTPVSQMGWALKKHACGIDYILWSHCSIGTSEDRASASGFETPVTEQGEEEEEEFDWQVDQLLPEEHSVCAYYLHSQVCQVSKQCII